MAKTTLTIKISDTAWWREVGIRLYDLFDYLDHEDLSEETQRKIAVLRKAIEDKTEHS